MKYLSAAEARNLPGLRLVLTAHMPGPWGEAAKALLSVRHVKYVPVAQAAMEANDDLYAWTGVRNAPVAVLDEEPPQTTWLDILLLAERLGSGAPLLPSDPLERALVLGFSTEICGADGFGWSRRLQLMGQSSTKNPPSSGFFRYGENDPLLRGETRGDRAGTRADGFRPERSRDAASPSTGCRIGLSGR